VNRICLSRPPLSSVPAVGRVLNYFQEATPPQLRIGYDADGAGENVADYIVDLTTKVRACRLE